MRFWSFYIASCFLRGSFWIVSCFHLQLQSSLHIFFCYRSDQGWSLFQPWISFKSAYGYYGDSWSRLIYKGASGWKFGKWLAYRYHAFKSRPANCSWCTEYSNEVLAIACYQLFQITLRVGNTSDRKRKWVILPKGKCLLVHRTCS